MDAGDDLVDDVEPEQEADEEDGFGGEKKEAKEALASPTTPVATAAVRTAELRAQRGYDFVVLEEWKAFPRDWAAVKDMKGENYLPKMARAVYAECSAKGVPTTTSSLPFGVTGAIKDVFNEAGPALAVDHGSMVYKGTGRFPASHIAATHDQTGVLSLLISNKASVQAPDMGNWTPLHCAANALALSCVKLLISEDAPVDARSSPAYDRQTALMRAAGGVPLDDDIGSDKRFKTQEEVDDATFQVMKALVGAGADIEAEDAKGRSILHLAACAGRLAAIRFALENRFDVNLNNDTDGCTPLHYAAMYDQPLAVLELLGKGAKPDLRNKEGKTPVDVAAPKALLALKGEFQVNVDNRGDCCTVM